MAQLYKKTGTCSRPDGAQTDYPMRIFVSETHDIPLCFSPALWLDASDADSITIVSDKVSQWADKSGNDRHAVQDTADYRPIVGSEVIGGKNTIQFDGSDDFLTVSSFPTDASAYSFFAVLKIDADPPSTVAKCGFLSFDADAVYDVLYPYIDRTLYLDFATTSRKTCDKPSTVLSSAHIVNINSAASSWQCLLNGSVFYSTTSNTVGMSSGTNYIGRSPHFFDGDFAEIIILPSVLSIANRQIVEGYLAHKWGITASLPTGHPYKSVAPAFVCCEAHCKTDFGDVRFFNAADAELKYWIDWATLQGTTPNQSVDMWVATSPGTTDTTVTAKYGDESLTDASDPSIFILRKDFESGSDGDSIADADEDWTVTGTVVIDTAQKHSGSKSVRLDAGATYPRATMALTAGDGYAISSWLRKTNAGGDVYPLAHGNGTKWIALRVDSSENIEYINAAGGTKDTTINCTYDVWGLYEVNNIDWTAGTYDIWFNGVCIKVGAQMYTNNAYANQLAIRNDSTTANYDAWIDDLIVRKYANPEPTWGAWGAEEEISTDTDFIVTTSLDGLLQDTLSATASLDAVLQGSPSSTVSLDSLLEDTNISSVSLDSMLVSTGSASAGLDAALVSAAPENWELTVETTDVDQTFTVNISVTATNIDITIDWDDGNAPVNYNTTGVKTCTYATAGTYYPKISGSFTNGGIKLGSRLKATGVIGGVTGFLSCGAMFDSCTGLTTVPADLFRYATGLGAGAFSSTFKGCSGLVSVPEDLFKYSTGAANNAFESTFNGCSALTAVPEGLFRYNTAVGIEGFKDTFRDCSSLTTVPEDLFRYNTAVTSSAFRSTFYGCTGLTSIPAGLFQYNLNVSTHGFYQVFKGCTSLTTLPALLFRNNLWVTTSGFAGAFQDCTSLTTIPELFFRYNERVSTSGFSQTFSGCTSLASLPVDLFRYNKLVSTSGFHRTFYGCNKLTLNSRIFYAGDGLITRFASPVPTQNFTECFKLAGAFTGVQGTAPAMWDYTFNGTPTSIDCFDGHSAESVTNYYDIPKVWGGPEAVTETTSLDGLLQKSFTATTSLDGLLQDTVSTTTSLDAYLPDTATSTVSLDSLLQESSSATTSLDSLLEDIVSVTASLDSLLEDTVSATASLDSLLRDTNSAITGLDGQLQSSSSASISIDGMLSSSNQATTGLDAVLSDSATVVILSLDSLLQDTNSATTSLDSTLASISSASASLDAALQDTNTATVSLDAALLESVTATVGLDAVVITAIMSETVSLDALLEGTETSTASLDAILKMYYIESVETEIDLESETIAGIIYQQSIAESFYLWTTSQPSWSISVTSTTDLASTLTFDLGIDVYSYVTFTETLSSKWTGQLSILEAIALTSTAEDVRYLLEAITSTYDLSGAQVVTFELALTEWLDIKSAASNSSKMFFELLSTAGLSCSTVGIWLEEITSALNISSLTQYDIVEALESATDLSDTTLIYLAAALSDSIDLSSESRVALALSVLSEIGFTSLASFIGAPQESILSELEIADTLEDNGIFNHSLASSVFLTEEAQAALSLLVTSVLALTSTAALKKWLTEQVTSAAILASNTSALQSMYPSLESSLTITETLLGNGAFYETVQSALQLSVSIELDGDVYECWVLNSPKFLPSIYTDYDFNSYCTYENRAFAANATGVYELAGNADDVQASVVLSETDFEVSGHKRFRKAYLGISGTSPVLIMETDGQRKVYSIASDGKVNASRELLGKYWKLSVVDFDSIEYISLIPVVLSRGK